MTCITGFALAQLPGTIAKIYIGIFQKFQLPVWLKSALEMRKHLGLISLFFLANHVILSLLIVHPGSHHIDEKDGYASMFASLGTVCYCILGICSLPSVAENMTSKQWQFVYGPFAW